MGKYKELKVDLKVTPELILHQLLINNRKHIASVRSELQMTNQTKAENTGDSDKVK